MEKSDNKILFGLAHNAFRPDNSVKSFQEQLEDFAFDEMPSGDMFLIAKSSLEAGIKECVDLPILMKQSILRKIQVDHELPLKELEKLPIWLHTYPLALQSLSDIDSLLLIADAKDKDGNDILIVLHLEKEYRQLSVNEISSIYGKKNLAYLIENTVKAGKEVFVNERTDGWLQQSRLPLPARIAKHLSDKIVTLNRDNVNINKNANAEKEPVSQKPLEDREISTREGVEHLKSHAERNQKDMER